MDQQDATTTPVNGASTARDLFLLTDEQILEIEPENEAAASPPSETHPQSARQDSSSPSAPRNDESQAASSDAGATEHGSRNTGHDRQARVSVTPEPPPWLATQMKDPWSGEGARELWNGVQQAREEAAAYRAAFATPEDARALKELYPGGVNDARAAASRARLLDDIDRSYFGAAGKSAEETSAARTQLAAMMLREDPAAFREMVFAGLRALEEAEKGSGISANASNLPRLAQVYAANRRDAQSAIGATLGSPTSNVAGLSTGGADPVPTVPARLLAANVASGAASFVGARHAAPASGSTVAEQAHMAAYAAFEKGANEDLERSVGATIAHTIQQALSNLGKDEGKATVEARHVVPLQERLGAAVRQDVEAALKGDRQLGEQIAQILSVRRFDNETRAQVVRLIDDRARQLVPSATKRVLNDWTQTTLAAHRGSAARSDAASTRREVEPVRSDSGRASAAANSPRTSQTRAGTDPNRNTTRPDSRRVDYRKLSDEQILEL